MFQHEVLSKIELAHYFNSAFTRVQVWKLLLTKIEYKLFNDLIDEMLGKNKIVEKEGYLYKIHCFEHCESKKKWSRQIFKKNKFYITLLTRIPFIKYMGLTGANAFESCNETDDIDLFVVSAKNRLWISYIIIVIVSKLINKRKVLCVNFLVDEGNLSIKQQNYYTAVQLMHIIPLYENIINKKIVESNLWIKEYLPNADSKLRINPFYLLKADNKKVAENKYHPGKTKRKSNEVLTLLNKLIYKKYYDRLQKKFPKEFGRGIILSEGTAKLNRVDYQDVYEKIFFQKKSSAIQ